MPMISAIGEAMGELRPTGNGQYEMGFAGDVFNTLAYVKMLGGDRWTSTFVSAIGDDPLSDAFSDRCNELGIENGCSREPGKSIGLYLINTDANGERTFAYWRSASPARSMINRLEDSQREALERSDYILVSGITLAILDDAQREALALLLSSLQPSCKIVFDPNYRARLWENADNARRWINRFYAISDIAMPGIDEERELFGLQSAEQILDREELQNNTEVVIKNGADEIIGRVNGERFDVTPERASNVVDTTAAGDSFNAGWLVARASGASPNHAARFGAEAAAIVIAHPGAIIDPGALARHALVHSADHQ